MWELGPWSLASLGRSGDKLAQLPDLGPTEYFLTFNLDPRKAEGPGGTGSCQHSRESSPCDFIDGGYH